MRGRRLGFVLRIAVAMAVVAAYATAIPDVAVAQGASPTIGVKVSSNRVEVGEPFAVEVRVTTQGTTAEPYQLALPAGLQQVGQSIMQGGGSTRQLVASFQIIATKPGRYTVPGPMVQWNGKQFTASPIKIDVVASSGRRSSPFMLPGGITMRFGSGEDEDDVPAEKDSPELALPSAPDSQIFLHAIADKKNAVIGEQVTVTLYAYFNANFHPEESHDAPFNDFRTVSLIQDSGTQQGVLYARVGKERFHVKVLGRVAAFPLRAGVLHTGAARLKLSSFRAGPSAERVANDEVITVTEPPIAYRPPGYRLGDVGQFTLQAVVQARRIDEGGAVPVLVTVTGSGSFPDSIRLPDRTGLEWLDPEKKENLQIRDGVVTGSRSFGYVVRVKETGSVDLGAITFSYWNPSAQRYETAKADLGKVEVARAGLGLTPSAKPASTGDPAVIDPFVGLSAARMTLGAYSAVRAPLWGEGVTLWGLLAAPPLLVVGAFAGSQSLRKARARRAAGAESKTALADKALAEAAVAETAGDMKALAAAIERAIHLAVEGATGLRSRGVLLADLAGELERVGVEPDLAEEVRTALVACESIRFDPDGRGAARDLGERARVLVRELAQTTPVSTWTKAPRFRSVVAAVIVAIATIALGASPARAEDAPPTPEALFKRGAEALQRGEHGTAIDAFEALADRGFIHPDASYDRGLAYVARVRAGAQRAGDLGRAAAAFEETLFLRPDDREADVALDRIRAELTRRRARKSRSSLDARPTLDRLVVGLASEQTWGLTAIVVSVLLAVGLVLRRKPSGRAHVAGSVLAPTAAVALLALVPLTLGARRLRLTTRPAVVVVEEVYLADDEGKSRPGDPLPEAALVEASEHRGGLVHVRWGAAEGWVPLGSVRPIGPDTTR